MAYTVTAIVRFHIKNRKLKLTPDLDTVTRRPVLDKVWGDDELVEADERLKALGDPWLISKEDGLSIDWN